MKKVNFLFLNSEENYCFCINVFSLMVIHEGKREYQIEKARWIKFLFIIWLKGVLTHIRAIDRSLHLLKLYPFYRHHGHIDSRNVASARRKSFRKRAADACSAWNFGIKPASAAADRDKYCKYCTMFVVCYDNNQIYCFYSYLLINCRIELKLVGLTT